MLFCALTVSMMHSRNEVRLSSVLPATGRRKGVFAEMNTIRYEKGNAPEASFPEVDLWGRMAHAWAEISTLG